MREREQIIGQVSTAADLVKLLSDRDRQSGEISENLAEMLKQIYKAQSVLDSDRFVTIGVLAELAKESTVNNNPSLTSFTEDLMEHLLKGGKPDDFFNKPENRRWEKLNIEDGLNNEIIVSLQRSPIENGKLLAGTTPIDSLPEKVTYEENDNEQEPISEKVDGITKDKESGERTKAKDNLQILLDNSDLWYEHGGTRYTTLEIISALLVLEGHTERSYQRSLALAKSTLYQSIIPKWNEANGRDGDTPIGASIPNTGRALKIWEEDVISLYHFMKDNLGITITSKYRINTEPIVSWPSLSKKKVK